MPTKDDEETRRAIDESLAPRLRDQETYLALAAQPHLPIACTGPIHLWDEYHHRLLDFSSGGAVMNVGHLNGGVKGVIREHLEHYDHPSSRQGEHVLRFPVEYAKALSETFPATGDRPQRVLYAVSEAEALGAAKDLAYQIGGVNPLVLALVSPGGNLLDAREAAAQAEEVRSGAAWWSLTRPGPGSGAPAPSGLRNSGRSPPTLPSWAARVAGGSRSVPWSRRPSTLRITFRSSPRRLDTRLSARPERFCSTS